MLLLSISLVLFTRQSIYLSKKEREFILFTFSTFIEYGDELGIQTKEQHKKISDELEKIKTKLDGI